MMQKIINFVKTWAWFIITPIIASWLFGWPITPLLLLSLFIIGVQKMSAQMGGGKISSLFVVAVAAFSIGLLSWNYGVLQFQRQFPFITATLPRTSAAADLAKAAELDPTALEAKAYLLLHQREGEKQTLTEVKNILNSGQPDALNKAVGKIQEAEDARAKIRRLISPPKRRGGEQDNFTVQIAGQMPDPADPWRGYIGRSFRPGDKLVVRSAVPFWYNPACTDDFLIPAGQARTITFSAPTDLCFYSRIAGTVIVTIQ